MRVYNTGKKTYTFDELIEKAKEIVESAYGKQIDRKWLEACADSYNDPRYRIKILVWEGSHAKGYVVINYGTQMIRAYGVNDKLLKTYDALGIK